MCKNPTRIIFTILIVFCSVGLLWRDSVVAQDDPYERYRIYSTGLSIINIGWTSDSSNLIYQIPYFDNVANRPISGPSTPNSDTWRQYSIATGQTSSGSIWPLQPNLTTQQYQSFEIYNTNLGRSFVFQSPNGRYLVYTATTSASSYGFPLGIADLNTGNHRVLTDNEGVKRNNSLGDIESYKIQWSEDNSAFTLHSTQRPGFYYISGLNDLNTLSIYSSESFPGLSLGSTTLYPGSVHDLSADGDRILTLGGTPENTGILAIWNMINSSGVNIPIQGMVTGATFTPGDQGVLFVDEGGLKHYNIASSQVVTLNPAINSTWALGGAYFSPNGEYLAINNAETPESLYVFELIGAGNTTSAFFRTDIDSAFLVDENEPPAYLNFAPGAPSGSRPNGQWVMGDWDGNGTDTPGVYGTNGVFYTSNTLGTSSTWNGTWFGLFSGAAGNRAVVGRFDANVYHDCIGVTDSSNLPPYGMAFALYFTCDLSGGNPPKTFQWLSVLLPDSQGHSGAWEFGAGDFDNDNIDTIAVRRGPFIAWTNVPPTTQNSAFSYAQYIGAPHTGTSAFVVGDWDNNDVDSFGLYYIASGRLRGRNDLDWNTGLYPLDRQFDTNIVGSSNVNLVSWHSN